MRSLQIRLCLSWYQSAELWVYFYKVHSQPNTKTGCSLEICIMSHRTSRIPFPTQIFTISFWFIVWLYDDQPIQCENRSDYWATSKQTVDITVSFSRLCIRAHTSAFNISHHHMSACAFCQLVIIQTSPAHFRYIPGLISSLCLWCKSSGSGVVHTNTDLQLICTLSARFFTNSPLPVWLTWRHECSWRRKSTYPFSSRFAFTPSVAKAVWVKSHEKSHILSLNLFSL